MSEPSLSTTAGVRIGPRTIVGSIAVSIAATGLLIGLATGRSPFASDAPWAPHAPDLSLLAAASPAIQIHVAGVVAALLIGLVLLSRIKGDRLHRILGWTWVVAMTVGAGASLFIHELNPEGFSFIHMFTGWTFLTLPIGVFAARTRKIRLHARTMTGLFIGGLVVAGAFTFVPGRLMWRIFFG